MTQEWIVDKYWRDEFILRNYPDMCDEGAVLWDGEIDIDTAIGDGNPKKWLDKNSTSYYVYYATEMYGMRHGRVIGVRKRRRDGMIVLTVKEPEHFAKIDVEVKDEETGQVKRRRRKKKTHTNVEIQYNAVLWALSPIKEDRVDVPYDNRLKLTLPKRLQEKPKKKARKGKNKKDIQEGGS